LRASGLVTFMRLGRQVQYTLADHRTIEALDTLREILRDRASRRANLLGSPQ